MNQKYQNAATLRDNIAPTASVSDVRSMIAKYRERYADVGYSEYEIYPGISEALEYLVTAGFTLGVCTSKRLDFAEKILAMFGLLSSFKFVDGGGCWRKEKRAIGGSG